jgi:hypothetical protein
MKKVFEENLQPGTNPAGPSDAPELRLPKGIHFYRLKKKNPKTDLNRLAAATGVCGDGMT